MQYLWYQMPRLEELEATPLISRSEAIRRCADCLACQADDLRAEARLVYYLASGPPEDRILVPQYRVAGTVRSADERVGRVEFQALYVRADRSATLQLAIEVQEEGDRLRATAQATGGLSPYRYSWHCSGLTPGAAGGQQIEFARPSSLDGVEEHLVAIVEDQARASASAVTLIATRPQSGPVDPLTKAGSEWAGISDSSSTGAFVGANAHDFLAILREAGWKCRLQPG